nr:hypothetical protein [Tanacetum cinerariifolium]
MSTRSSARNLFSPLDNPNLTIRRRSRADTTLLNDFEIAAEGNGNLQVPNLRTMKELCQPSLNGRGGPIALIAIQETNFRLKNDMIQQVQNSCQFYGLPGDDANKHLDKFLHVTQIIKVNGVTDDALHLYLFPHSLTHHATSCFDRLPRNSINTFEQMAKMFFGKNFPPSMVTKLRNEITNFRQSLKAEMAEISKNLMRVLQVMKPNTASSSCSGTLPSNTITNPQEELKGITTRSGTAYQGPTIPTTSSSLLPVVECETEATRDTAHPTNNGSTKDVQPPIVQTESIILNSKPVVAPIIEPVVAPVTAPKPNQRPTIPYPTRLQDQKLRDKANDQREKFFQIFKDLNFNISFADALILVPKFGPTIKTLLTNKDKLYELARTPLNEHCLAVLLKKFPEKLGDPVKFFILCDFPRMAECLALADLDASINLMPLSIWNKLSLPDLSPTYFDVDPRVPQILGRSFLKTERALIDVFEGELTLRVGKEAITFNLNQTSRYSANYNDMTALIWLVRSIRKKFSISPIDFLLEEVDAFLALEDDPTSPKVDQSYVDTEGDILLLEAFLNDDPLLPPSNQGNYLLQVRKELKICEAKTDKSSIDEPPEVKLKDLPPHLEYAFLEGNDKFPDIIAKDLSVEEKNALRTVLKSHKRAIAWKLSAVQHQRRVNPKIYDVIKNEVLKLLDAGLIYPISDTPWDLPFELMCDVSDSAIGAVLGQRHEKHFRPIHYASKTMIEAESNYTTTEKEMLAVVYAVENSGLTSS